MNFFASQKIKKATKLTRFSNLIFSLRGFKLNYRSIIKPKSIIFYRKKKMQANISKRSFKN